MDGILLGFSFPLSKIGAVSSFQPRAWLFLSCIGDRGARDSLFVQAERK
jgi:hypothetical protein